MYYPEVLNHSVDMLVDHITNKDTSHSFLGAHKLEILIKSIYKQKPTELYNNTRPFPTTPEGNVSARVICPTALINYPMPDNNRALHPKS